MRHNQTDMAEINRALGRIEAKLNTVEKKQDSFETRLNEVEKIGARNGAVCGAVISIGTGVILSMFKNKTGL